MDFSSLIGRCAINSTSTLSTSLALAEAMVNRIGEDNQSWPVLGLASKSHSVRTDVTIDPIRADRFVSGARAIGLFWSICFGTWRPH